jgi:two-component system, chemotaxis family, sensor histidine kinase and response regulator WspE
MTDSNESGVPDAFMLELFCSEVETQVTLLSEGLLALEHAPQNASSLEALMRAAHSIKGAARIVQLDAVVGLAHAVEDCFVAAQEERLLLTGEPLEQLLHGADQLAFLAELRATEMAAWLAAHEAKMREIAVSLRALLQRSAGTEQETLPSAEPSTAARSQAVPSPTLPVVASEQSPPAESSVAVEVVSNEPQILDTSMLELFSAEAETHATALSAGLLALEHAPQNASSLEALMRAAHSIKGAARIVQLDAVVELAHALEDCFVAAQAGRFLLAGESLETVLRGADHLVSLAKLSPTEMAMWLSAHGAELRETAEGLRALLRRSEEAKQGAPTAAEPAAVVPAPGPAQPATPSPPLLSSQPTDKTRAVRVTAENLSHLLGLAEESVVKTRWLQPFATSLLRLQRSQRELSEALTGLQESLVGVDLNEHAKNYLAAAQQKAESCCQVLADRLQELDRLVGHSLDLSERLYREAVATRMRPFADGAQGFPRMMHDLARKLGKQVKLDIVGQSVPVDRDVVERLTAPLTHLLRNALDHGIETPEERLASGKPAEGTIRLEARHQAGTLSLLVSDDGRGVDVEQLREKIIEKQLAPAEIATALPDHQLLKFLFVPGFSTAEKVTEVSGRGVGLDVVQNMVREVGGELRAVSQPGKGMSFQLQLPLTLSIMRALIVGVAGEPYAFPLARIEQVMTVPQAEIAVQDECSFFVLDGQNINLVSAQRLWQLADPEVPANPLPVVIIGNGNTRYGVTVDALLGESDIIVRPLDVRLGRVSGFSAAAFLRDGSPALIVDVEDLLQSIVARLGTEPTLEVPRPAVNGHVAVVRKRILVVDDSETMRTVERDILVRHGYDVDVAEDGMEGWDAIRLGSYDLLITDVEMPRMTGIKLVSLVKQEPWLLSTPVLIVSGNEREEDRRLGLAAGASDYLTKSSFREETFVHVVTNLIGEAYPEP